MISNFSKKEKFMLFILFILLIGLIYYRFVYITVNSKIDAANGQADALQTELDAANKRLSRIKSMDKIDSLSQRMGSYNNIKMETAYMNTALSGAPDYTVTFEEVTREGNLVRRNFQLRFTTADYASAVNIIKYLTEGELRCKVSDVRCTIGDGGETTMDVTGTFYETMVGGKPDSALPPEESVEDKGVDVLME